MTTSPRNDELAAIRVLVDLHGDDGPDEWEPYHFDTAEVAARTLAGYLRRDGKRLSAQKERTERQVASGLANTKTRTTSRRSRPRKPAELVTSERIVRERSGGDCEALTPWCEGRATQAHHVAGRTDHRPEALLDVCGQGNVSGCHGYIHQHPTESYAAGWMVKRNGVRSGCAVPEGEGGTG